MKNQFKNPETKTMMVTIIVTVVIMVTWTKTLKELEVEQNLNKTWTGGWSQNPLYQQI